MYFLACNFKIHRELEKGSLAYDNPAEEGTEMKVKGVREAVRDEEENGRVLKRHRNDMAN